MTTDYIIYKTLAYIHSDISLSEYETFLRKAFQYYHIQYRKTGHRQKLINLVYRLKPDGVSKILPQMLKNVKNI